MNMLHLALLAISAAALAATTATGKLAERRTVDGVHLQLVAYVVGGALMIGNAACMLPGTPVWYSALLVTATAAGLMWLFVGVVRVNRAPATPTSYVRPRSILDEDDATVRPIVRARVRPQAPQERALVTSEMIHDAGPADSRKAASNTVYVAASLPTYVPGFAARRHQHTPKLPTQAPAPAAAAASAPAPAPAVASVPVVRFQSPTTAKRHLRLARAYSQAPERRSRITSKI